MADFWDDIATADFRGEGNVELRLVTPLLHALGYGPEDIDAKYPVVFQEGRTGRRHEADFACFYGPLHNRDTSLLVVEAKRPGESLPDGKAQGESYAANLRAPLLLLTNGQRLEIWQLQATQESIRVLDIPASSMKAERGKIEQLCGKAAVHDYCRRFHVKTILEASADYAPYETAELKRIVKRDASIPRTVRQLADGAQPRDTQTDRLLSDYVSGAVIFASSGYGKTTLAHQLLRQAIEERWRGNRPQLPFDVPLADLEQSGQSILKFMHSRLSAHCPGVTEAALTAILRDPGATIICDGFDRTTASFQRKIAAELALLLRDYPLIQLFVFSRAALKPAIALPPLELWDLSEDQIRELERVILSDGNALHFSVVGMMPPTLRALCGNPLLLRLALDYWKEKRDFPRQIEVLFRSWLDAVLKTEPNEYTSAIEREQALTILSLATVEAPISKLEALALFEKHDVKAEILNELIACDAVRTGGVAVEIQHEALADYLRAKALASMGEEEVIFRLAGIALPANSFFPVLLMSQLRTHRLQSEFWTRLSKGDLGIYLDALRYRFDVSGELGKLDAARLSEDYLRDLIDGIEAPLEGFFPSLRQAVIENMTDDGDAPLAVTGIVRAHPGALNYKLHALEPEGARITIAAPAFPGTLRGVDLDLSRYRIDSARLLGMTLLRDTLLETIKHQQLKGGVEWAAERLLGRVRYLAEQHGAEIGLSDGFDKLEVFLKPHADEWVEDSTFRGGERFPIQSLLEDIAVLRAAGRSGLDPWWLRLGWDNSVTAQDDEVLRRVLDEEHRRVQIVYDEVIRASFPGLTGQMGFLGCLPIRWRLTVVKRDRSPGSPSIYFHWLPVQKWEEAGADVIFADDNVPVPDFEKVSEALAKLGRPTSSISAYGGFQPLAYYDGRQWNGHFDGATPVTHEVCWILTDELKHLFDALPGSDGAF